MRGGWTAWPALLLAVSLLAGCATPEQQVRSGLVRAGLAPPIAGCMAPRMVNRLNLLQLRRLGRLGDINSRTIRQLSVAQFLDRTRALQDPEIIAVVATSAGTCALGH